MRVQVKFGHLDMDEPCPRCDWKQVVDKDCPKCGGSGKKFTIGEGYTYEAGNLDLKVGDKVRVPPTKFQSHPQHATVIRIGGSSYTGPVKKIHDKISSWGDDG